MREPILKIAQRLGIILGGLLLVWQILIGIQALSDGKIQNLYGGYLCLALALVFLSYALQVVSWGVLMRGLQVHIPCKSLFRGYILSFLPRYIPGSVWGYLSRSEWLRAEFRVSYAISTSGSLLEIAVALISTGLIAGIYIANLLDEARNWIVLGLILMLSVMWLLVHGILQIPWVLRLVDRSDNCATKLRLPISNWLLSVAMIVWNMILYGMALYLTGRGLGLVDPLSFGNVFVLAANYSMAWLLGFAVFFLPAGIGIREVTLSALLASSLGVSPVKASLLSVLFRLIGTVAEMLWGVIGLIMYRDMSVHVPNASSDRISGAERKMSDRRTRSRASLYYFISASISLWLRAFRATKHR